METVGSYIKRNMPVFQTFVKLGKMPITVVTAFEIHELYLSLTHIPGKMDRYSHISEKLNIDEWTVRMAVAEMELKLI